MLWYLRREHRSFAAVEQLYLTTVTPQVWQREMKNLYR